MRRPCCACRPELRRQQSWFRDHSWRSRKRILRHKALPVGRLKRPGGAWQPMFWSDFGGGVFDGAHPVMNFKMLHPSRSRLTRVWFRRNRLNQSPCFRFRCL